MRPDFLENLSFVTLIKGEKIGLWIHFVDVVILTFRLSLRNKH